QARTVDTAAVVPQETFLVENRHVEPAVVRMEAGRPDDGANLAAAQIDLQPRRRGDARLLEALRRGDLQVPRTRTRPLIERIEQALHLEIGERKQIAQP